MSRLLMMIDDAAVGGGQHYVLWLVQRLQRDKYGVEVACAGEGYLTEKLRESSIPVHPLRMTNRANLRSLFRCYILMRRMRPDIVHTHGGTAGFFGRICARLAGVGAVIHTYHGIHYLHAAGRFRRILYRWVDRFLLGCTTRTVVVCRDDLELALAHGLATRDSAVVIPPAIDVRRFHAVPKTEEKAAGTRTVGTIGRLHVQKGHIYLLEAAHRLLQRRKGVMFEIVGDGDLGPRLRRKAEELGIADSVRFLGGRTDVPDLLRKMDLFVLPSLWEGLPIVLLEAMAAGVPIVASGVNGVQEAVRDDQEALLVPPRDPERLAAAMERVLDDGELAARLSRQALLRVQKDFDISNLVQNVERLYEEVQR